MTTALKEPKYKYNQTIVKVYNGKFIKVIRMRCLRNAGVETDEKFPRGVNDEKLDYNIARTKSRIFDVACCNNWDYFFTGTIDPQKYDRTDLEKYHKDFTQFLRDQNKKHGCKIKFLVVPELHSDGRSWHLHGFLSGLPEDQLQRFRYGVDRMSTALAVKVLNGDPVYNWTAYAQKFGFCDLEPIKNAEAVSKYIQKYICKDLARSVSEVGAHMYYRSRGLWEPTIEKIGVSSLQLAPTYESEYVSITWLPYTENELKRILDSFI